MSYPFNEAKFTVCYAALRWRGEHCDTERWRREEFDLEIDAESRVTQLRKARHASISIMTPAGAVDWNAISFTRQKEAP